MTNKLDQVMLTTGADNLTFKNCYSYIGGDLITLDEEKTGRIISFIVSENKETFINVVIRDGIKMYNGFIKPEDIIDFDRTGWHDVFNNLPHS